MSFINGTNYSSGFTTIAMREQADLDRRREAANNFQQTVNLARNGDPAARQQLLDQARAEHKVVYGSDGFARYAANTPGGRQASDSDIFESYGIR